MKPVRDSGYAMLAAILGIAAFSYVAFQVLAENRGIISVVQAESERARLTAACNAGLTLVVQGLASKNKKQQWLIDSSKRIFKFDDVTLTVVVEDERGKIPLNGINEDQVRQIFSTAGVFGARLDTLVDSYEDWIDPDNERRDNGAEAPDYAALGYKPRNGSFRTASELRYIKGMDADTYARVAPVSTTFFGESGGFSESTSQPLALAALSEIDMNSKQVLRRQQEIAGLRPAEDATDPPYLTGRTLTVRVEASRAGATIKRSGIIELTGNADDPFWTRYLE